MVVSKTEPLWKWSFAKGSGEPPASFECMNEAILITLSTKKNGKVVTKTLIDLLGCQFWHGLRVQQIIYSTPFTTSISNQFIEFKGICVMAELNIETVWCSAGLPILTIFYLRHQIISTSALVVAFCGSPLSLMIAISDLACRQMVDCRCVMGRHRRTAPWLHWLTKISVEGAVSVKSCNVCNRDLKSEMLTFLMS